MLPLLRYNQIIGRSLRSLETLKPTLTGSFGYARRNYAAKKPQSSKEDKSFIDLDTEKLCSYVCINYLADAKEPGPKILPDDQYPKWLFELYLDGKKEVEELDPEIDGWEYWKAYSRRAAKQEARHRKLRTRFLHLQNSPSMKKSEGIAHKPAPVQ
uniref:Large ribosomal subunit protein mL54 n=1 Tax=Syphacia muris TaxID=451379 RepID=A0A0N5AUL6_9BILA